MDICMAKNIGRAKFVKKAREERGWPQWQLAKVAGVTLRTIQRLEKDGAASPETLKGVAQAFDLDVGQLNSKSKPQENAPPKNVHLMPRLTSGKELAAIVGGADQFQVEHDEADDKRALDAMVSVLNYLKRDLIRWHDADPAGKLKIEFDLTQEINGLEKFGFYLFGVKRMIPQITDEERTLTSMCTIYMSHARSPKIIRDKKSNMAIPALLTEVAR